MGLRSRLAKALARRAHALIVDERLKAAERLVELGMVVFGRPSELLYLKGLIANQSGEPDLERRYYEEALAADPGNLEARTWLAALLVLRGDKRQALHHAHQLRIAGGATAEFAFKFGGVLAQQERDHAEALAWYELAEELGHHGATICRAHCLLNLGRTQEAFDLYREAAADEEAWPNIVLDSKLGMAKATFDLGDPRRALRRAQQALAEHESEVGEEDLAYARDVIAWLEDEVVGLEP